MIHFTPPPDVRLGPLVLNCHGLFFLFGALAAYLWTRARVPREHHEHLDFVASWMTLGGILGARLLYVLLNPSILAEPWRLLALWEGGLVSYGGLVGAALAWWLYLRRHGLPLDLFNHAIGPPALMAWGIGRIGCLLNWWHEYGTVTAVPWAFVVGQEPPRHPVMLYLAVGHILAALAAAFIARGLRLRADGLALMGYGLVRGTFDVWRDYDPEWLRQGSQAVAAGLFLLGLVLVLRGRYPESSPSPELEAGGAPEAPSDLTP